MTQETNNNKTAKRRVAFDKPTNTTPPKKRQSIKLTKDKLEQLFESLPTLINSMTLDDILLLRTQLSSGMSAIDEKLLAAQSALGLINTNTTRTTNTTPVYSHTDQNTRYINPSNQYNSGSQSIVDVTSPIKVESSFTDNSSSMVSFIDPEKQLEHLQSNISSQMQQFYSNSPAIPTPLVDVSNNTSEGDNDKDSLPY